VHVGHVVGLAPTATGKGYWMVGVDGGVFAFGDAGYVGSVPGLGVRVENIVSIVSASRPSRGMSVRRVALVGTLANVRWAVAQYAYSPTP
jgi:hypothetical protein